MEDKLLATRSQLKELTEGQLRQQDGIDYLVSHAKVQQGIPQKNISQREAMAVATVALMANAAKKQSSDAQMLSGELGDDLD